MRQCVRFGDEASSKKNEFPPFFKCTPLCNSDRRLNLIDGKIISNESLIVLHAWCIYIRAECRAVAMGSAARWADIFAEKKKKKKLGVV